MQTAAVDRAVLTTGVSAQAEFGISQKHAAHIMGILRSTLYTRKALAVLREYGSNAWDEHRQSGQPDRPIKVTLPTVFKPTLRIRDYGRGLSEHDVLYIYTQYGESTKRETNNATGMLGIGGKSGFCYTDSFTVTSWHQGCKSVYVAALDKTNKGVMQKVFDVPCDTETGIEIQMGVRPQDVDEFQREARALFRYFNPQPEINVTLEPLPPGMSRGFIIEQRGDWIAVMGCIPYRLDIAQLKEPLIELGLWDALERLSGGIYLPIGAVEFSASREELQYTGITVAAVAQHFRLLFDDFATDAASTLTRPDLPGWDRRLKACFMQHILKIPLPPNLQTWALTQVKIEPSVAFHLVDTDLRRTNFVNVRQGAAILLRDKPDLNLRGWHFNTNSDVVAIPAATCSDTEVLAEIHAKIKASHLDGVPIHALSSRAWWGSTRTGDRGHYPTNQKHKDRTFILRDPFYDDSVKSTQWESAGPPDTDHVYTILQEFCPKGTTLQSMSQDRSLITALGGTWPTIYGYKITSRVRVTPQDIEHGTPYLQWRQTTFQALVTEETQEIWRNQAWESVFPNAYSGLSNQRISWGTLQQKLPGLIEQLSTDLGEKHPVTRYFGRYREACIALRKGDKNRSHHIARLFNALENHPQRNAPREWLQRLHQAYPMFQATFPQGQDMALFLADPQYRIIIEYIRQCDQKATPKA